MRPELKLYFDGQADQPATTTTTTRNRPHFAVCLVVLDKTGDHLETRPVKKFPRSYDAVQFAGDLAKSPGAVEGYVREFGIEQPDHIVVMDSAGKELDGSRKPVLGVVRQPASIWVYVAQFVGPEPGAKVFDKDPTPVACFEDPQQALDWAENLANDTSCRGYFKRNPHMLSKNTGFLVETNGSELGRFLLAEKKDRRRVGWRSMAQWFIRQLGY